VPRLADWDATVLERAFRHAMISSEIAASKIADRGLDNARRRLPLAQSEWRDERSDLEKPS